MQSINKWSSGWVIHFPAKVIFWPLIIFRLSKLYICEYCLKYMKSRNCLQRHMVSYPSRPFSSHLILQNHPKLNWEFSLHDWRWEVHRWNSRWPYFKFFVVDITALHWDLVSLSHLYSSQVSCEWCFLWQLGSSANVFESDPVKQKWSYTTTVQDPFHCLTDIAKVGSL